MAQLKDYQHIAHLPNDLAFIKESLYDPVGVTYSRISIDTESKAYSGVTFYVAGLWVVFRVAGITPKKSGQFVTLWQRNNRGITQPYDANDAIDFLIICTRKGPCFGVFIFPKSVLLQQGILSHYHEGGKRAIRVYPPWDTLTSKQAQATQKWQVAHFLTMSDPTAIDLELFKSLHFQPR